MNGASAEYVTITEPSLDAPRLTTMLVQARAIEPHPLRTARANAATDRRGLDMRTLLVGSSVCFPGSLEHTAWQGPGEAIAASDRQAGPYRFLRKNASSGSGSLKNGSSGSGSHGLQASF